MTLRTIGCALRDAAQTNAGFWHVDERGAGRFVSHAELYADACRIAGGLRDAGFGAGSDV